MTTTTSTLQEDIRTIMIIYRSSRFRMRNVLQKIVEKIKTHILSSIIFAQKSCRLWDNMEKFGKARQATDDNIIRRRMRFACLLSKATDTNSHRIRKTYCFSTATMVTRTRIGVTFIRTVPVLSWTPCHQTSVLFTSHCNFVQSIILAWWLS
jgi:hypothetical protein